MSTPEQHFDAFLQSLGFQGDPEMATTPQRVTEFLRGFLPEADAPEVGTSPFRGGSGPVILRDIPFYSLCAHHLLPFFGHATVAYTPRTRLAGLGSIPRVIQHFARRPQLQERLCEQVASHLYDSLEPQELVVRLVARHMCVEMRGAAVPPQVEVVASRGGEPDLLWARVDC